MQGSLIPCIAKFSIGARSIDWYEIYKKVSTLDSYKPFLQSFDISDEYRLYMGTVKIPWKRHTVWYISTHTELKAWMQMENPFKFRYLKEHDIQLACPLRKNVNGMNRWKTVRDRNWRTVLATVELNKKRCSHMNNSKRLIYCKFMALPKG